MIGNELHIEQKLEVLDAMLTPAPERPRKRKSDPITEDRERIYICDLCETAFSRANQFYGHLHSHSGERNWECAICPGKVMCSTSLNSNLYYGMLKIVKVEINFENW